MPNAYESPEKLLSRKITILAAIVQEEFLYSETQADTNLAYDLALMLKHIANPFAGYLTQEQADTLKEKIAEQQSKHVKELLAALENPISIIEIEGKTLKKPEQAKIEMQVLADQLANQLTEKYILKAKLEEAIRANSKDLTGNMTVQSWWDSKTATEQEAIRAQYTALPQTVRTQVTQHHTNRAYTTTGGDDFLLYYFLFSHHHADLCCYHHCYYPPVDLYADGLFQLMRFNYQLAEGAVHLGGQAAQALGHGAVHLGRAVGDALMTPVPLHSGGGGGGGGSCGGGSGDGDAAPLFLVIAAILAAALAAIIAAASAAYAGLKNYKALRNLTTINKPVKSTVRIAATGLGVWGGIKVGAIAGASVGSVIPGVGTAIGAIGGAVIGGCIGAGVGSFISKYAMKLFTSLSSTASLNSAVNHGDVKIIDLDARSYCSTNASKYLYTKEHEVKLEKIRGEALRKQFPGHGINHDAIREALKAIYLMKKQVKDKTVLNKLIKKIKAGTFDINSSGYLEIHHQSYRPQFFQIMIPQVMAYPMTTFMPTAPDAQLEPSAPYLPSAPLKSNKDNWGTRKELEEPLLPSIDEPGSRVLAAANIKLS